MLGFDEDTIVAVASPRTPAQRGIVRLSGPHSVPVAYALIRPKPKPKRFPTRYTGMWLCPSPIGEVPVAAYVWPTTRSFTGEPSVEIHTIGSPPIIDAILRSCVDAGCRLARPGEFTMRAFLSGRIDLTQAEAILGVIEADNDSQLRASLRLLAGGMGHPLERLRQSLLESLAHLEAGLDFVEEDIDFISDQQLLESCRQARVEVESLLNQLRERRGSDAVMRVVLVGPPNVGKSSLFNALLGRDAALIQDRAGTTRDPVTGRTKWGDLTIELVDTAGIEEDRLHHITSASQELRASATMTADLLVSCRAAGDADAMPEVPRPPDSSGTRPSLAVYTKSDLVTEKRGAGIWVSSVTGEGIDELRKAVAAQLQQLDAAPAGLAERCRLGMLEVAESLGRAEQAVRDGMGEEVVAAELRAALRRLGELVGAFYTDELLDQIFGQFCIGK